jgi:outer membrane immunogenic protein
MRQRIATLFAIAVGVGVVHSASAADIPTKAPVYRTPAAVVAYNWSGVYIGGNVGAAWQRNCWTFLRGPVEEGCHNDTAVTAGGQLGVNWQAGNWVYGLEASGNWANLKGSSISTGFPTFTNETRTDAIALFTGRVGWAWNNTLAYVKGGAALTDNQYHSFLTATPATSSTVNDTRWGWTVGGGLEWGFAPNWSTAVEYDYVDTGAKDEGTATTNVFDRITQRIHMATLRVNYRFAPWVWR